MTSSMNGWTKVEFPSLSNRAMSLLNFHVIQDAATSGRSWPYLYSKSAIGHATSSLAHEFLPLGIRVNGIAPGKLLLIQTQLTTTDGLLGWFVTEVGCSDRYFILD